MSGSRKRLCDTSDAALERIYGRPLSSQEKLQLGGHAGDVNGTEPNWWKKIKVPKEE